MRFAEFFKKPIVIGSGAALIAAGAISAAITASSSASAPLAACSQTDDGVNRTIVCPDPATQTVTTTVTAVPSTPSSTTVPSTTAASSTSSAPPTQPASTDPAFTSSVGVPTGTPLHVVQANETGVGWHSDANRNIYITCGATVTGLDIYGIPEDMKCGYTLTKSIIRCVGEANWCVGLHGGAMLSQDEIGGGADGKTQLGAIAFRADASGSAVQNVIDRVNIHDTIHGGRLDGGTRFSNSWVHNIPISPDYTKPAFPGAHTDGVMCTGYANPPAAGGIQVLNDRLQGGNTAVFFVQWESGNTLYGAAPFVLDRDYFVGDLDPNPAHNPPWQSSFGISFENKGLDTSGSKFIQITNDTFTDMGPKGSNGGFQVGYAQAPAGRWTASNNKTVSGAPVAVTNS